MSLYRCARRLRARSNAFLADEGGTLIVASLFFLLAMVLVTGLAIDLMRTELMRTRLQITADNAAIAAVGAGRRADPRQVVQDHFARAGLGTKLEAVEVARSGPEDRRVSVSTDSNLPTLFLGLTGIGQLHARSTTAAVAEVEEVELSLVLNISGSMGENGKLGGLKQATTYLIDELLGPGAPGGISINLVPFSDQVSVGRGLLDQLGVSPLHEFSNCIDFAPNAFGSTRLVATPGLAHTQHFQLASTLSVPIDTPLCPNRAPEQVAPLSQDGAALKAQVAALRPRGGSAPQIGLKWATGLLDPGFRPIAANLPLPTPAGRPLDYGRAASRKVLVLVTDGGPEPTRRLRPRCYDSLLDILLWNRVSVLARALLLGQDPDSFLETRQSAAQNARMFTSLCASAKRQGVVIYTVGLQTDPRTRAMLSACASSPAYHFDTTGAGLIVSFSTIVQRITTLKLVR
ncbi:Tad domain-containing protein [Oceanicola sp. 502str15]|uniref:Tad domain-containing protein n=1 Tax=Oceanicola sp. 502str15 TaxID=2696061 RepID=UPI00273A5E00|nr:Tad domain-containing protein [Oceanicola sp. 502str15]MCO6381599.1 hypothetical protein [Oceanicola sp. 502str15]